MHKSIENPKVQPAHVFNNDDVPVPKNEGDYALLMAKIDQLIITGNGTINNKDLELYRKLAQSAATYENNVYAIPPPSTLEGLLEWKMYELKLKQRALAEKLHVSDTKLSLIMSGKQKPDVLLLKRIHTELGIDGNVLLNVI